MNVEVKACRLLVRPLFATVPAELVTAGKAATIKTHQEHMFKISMAASQELQPLVVIFMRLLHERTKCARDG